MLDLVCLTLWWGWCARAFGRGNVPESRQGHCLLLYITLHPSGHLREEEANRRLTAVTSSNVWMSSEHTVPGTTHSKDIKGLILTMCNCYAWWSLEQLNGDGFYPKNRVTTEMHKQCKCSPRTLYLSPRMCHTVKRAHTEFGAQTCDSTFNGFCLKMQK